MIRRLLGLLAVLTLASLLIQKGGVAAAPIFTGNAETDFNPLTQAGVQVIVDANGIDVGLPSQFPLGSISGWDLKDVRVLYEAGSDTLFVAVNAYGILGDVDGDGDPGNTSGLLAMSGGVDRADLAGTESVAVVLDLDEDGVPDVIAGVPALQDFSSLRVSRFAGSLANPAFAFGTVLPGHLGTNSGSPSAASPDLEFSIQNFSALPKSSGSDLSTASFGVNAFAGSVEDDGVGEDFAPGGGMFGGAEDPTPTPVPSPTPTQRPAEGTGTPGFWKNHPEAWPQPGIVIGGVTYSREEAIALMNQGQSKSSGGKELTLFRALVAAKLNVLSGNDGSCVAPTIALADAWMARYPVGSKVAGGSAAWAEAAPLNSRLDAYNNGKLCAAHRG